MMSTLVCFGVGGALCATPELGLSGPAFWVAILGALDLLIIHQNDSRSWLDGFGCGLRDLVVAVQCIFHGRFYVC